jgi:hypothetical protein
LGLARRTKTMMAWILVSLLASFVGDAVVAFSPESGVSPEFQKADGNDNPPPKP